jgi:FKBP-type peptidyl-prolyl cis-trans isomerase FkpA
MRKTLIAASAIAALGLMGCQKDTASTETPSSATTASVDATAMSDTQKQDYAMGASMAVFVNSRVEEIQKLGGDLDKDLVVKGFIDTLEETSPFSLDEIRQFAQAGEQAMRQLQEQQAEKSAAENLEAGAAFLAENAKKEGIVTTESGLQYEIVEEGNGPSPEATDTVRVHYKGTLLDGTEFDSSYSRGEPAVFPLNRVIAGWTEGVQLMKQGGKYRFYIPSELAYGQRATGAITPNSTLIFDVELLEVVSSQSEEE